MFKKKMIKKVLLSTAIMSVCSFGVMAQTPRVDQFSANKAVAIEGVRIQTNKYELSLWGIDVPRNDSIAKLRAREALDQSIRQGAIQCKVHAWSGKVARSQCVNNAEQDLALMLLSQGRAFVDRSDLNKTPELSKAYNEAEARAIKLQKGIWFDPTKSAISILDFENLPPELKQNLFIVLGLISFGPLAGLLVVAFIMFAGFGRLIRLQKTQMAKTSKDEKELKDREKFVLASSLEGELQANKSKVEAFITIYKDLLRDMRNPNKMPKYKQTGDIIHDKPALMRMVYDANIDKISLLGPSIAGLLSKLYAEIEVNPRYETLEPDTPLEEAEGRVEKIVIASQEFLPVIDKLLNGLNVVIRGKNFQG